MKCPVCKESILIHELLCQHCGFADLHREFINVADALDWEQQVVIPYRTKWEEQQGIEPWLRKEYKRREYYEKISKEENQTIRLKNRSDLRVNNPGRIQTLFISDNFAEEVDTELVSDISKFCNLKELSFSGFYSKTITAEIINNIFTACPGITKLQILGSIDWQTLAEINLSRIEYLWVGLQGQVLPVKISAPHLKFLRFSIYFSSDLRKKIPREYFDFSGMPLLEELSISNGMTMDYASLATLTKLKKLTITEDKKLKDLSWISDTYKLDHLYIQGRVGSILGLEKQKHLRHLELMHNSISDITVISELKELEYLNLRFNKITNAAALTGLKKLKHLDLFENPILDETTLRQLNIPTTIFNKFDRQMYDIDRLFEGTSFSDDIYRWIKSQDSANVESANPYRKRFLIEWHNKSDRDKLIYAAQCVFERKYRMMTTGEDFPYRDFDHRHRRVFIDKALQHYPFLTLTIEMQADMTGRKL